MAEAGEEVVYKKSLVRLLPLTVKKDFFSD